MEKEAIKGVYQVDVNGSPTKMVVLSAKNNDMLAQIFKITASTLTKSPIYTGKTSNRQSSRKNSNYKDPLRNQTNDIQSQSQRSLLGSLEKSRQESTFKNKLQASKTIDYSPSENILLKKSAFLNLIEEKQKENTIAHQYVKRALERENSKSQVRKQDSILPKSQSCDNQLLVFSGHNIQELKETNDQLIKLKEDYLSEINKNRYSSIDHQPNKKDIVDLKEESLNINQSYDYLDIFTEKKKNFLDKIRSQTILQEPKPQATSLKPFSERQSSAKKRLRQNYNPIIPYHNSQQKIQDNILETSGRKNSSNKKTNPNLIQTKSFHSQSKSLDLNCQPVVSQTFDCNASKILQAQTFDVIEEQAHEKMDSVTLTSKLNIIKSRVNKYMKDINFKTIIHFKRQVEPSKSCYRAAKCLCLLLQAMNKSHQSFQSFNDWTQIKAYINNNQYKIMQDIYALKNKFEKKDFRYDKILEIYNDIFLIDNCQIEITSPRIRNLEYKPIFCLCFFMINLVIVSEQLEKTKMTQVRTSQLNVNKTITAYNHQSNISSTVFNQHSTINPTHNLFAKKVLQVSQPKIQNELRKSHTSLSQNTLSQQKSQIVIKTNKPLVKEERKTSLRKIPLKKKEPSPQPLKQSVSHQKLKQVTQSQSRFQRIPQRPVENAPIQQLKQIPIKKSSARMNTSTSTGNCASSRTLPNHTKSKSISFVKVQPKQTQQRQEQLNKYYVQKQTKEYKEDQISILNDESIFNLDKNLYDDDQQLLNILDTNNEDDRVLYFSALDDSSDEIDKPFKIELRQPIVDNSVQQTRMVSYLQSSFQSPLRKTQNNPSITQFQELSNSKSQHNYLNTRNYAYQGKREQLEHLLQEWQQMNNTNCDKSDIMSVSGIGENDEKYETIQRLKEQRQQSCQRKRGKQLEENTLNIIKELSHTFQN